MCTIVGSFRLTGVAGPMNIRALTLARRLRCEAAPNIPATLVDMGPWAVSIASVSLCSPFPAKCAHPSCLISRVQSTPTAEKNDRR